MLSNHRIILLFFSKSRGEYGREASGKQGQDLTYSIVFRQSGQPLHLVAHQFVCLTQGIQEQKKL